MSKAMARACREQLHQCIKQPVCSPARLNQARHYIARTSRAQPHRIWPYIACKVQQSNALSGTQGHCRAQYAACCFVKHAMTLGCKLRLGPALQCTSGSCSALAYLVSNLHTSIHSLSVMSCLSFPVLSCPGSASSLTRHIPCVYKPLSAAVQVPKTCADLR